MAVLILSRQNRWHQGNPPNLARHQVSRRALVARNPFLLTINDIPNAVMAAAPLKYRARNAPIRIVEPTPVFWGVTAQN
jgi:hypothetical protein